MAIAERQKRRIPIQSLGFTALLLLILAGLFWPTPYMVTYPGITLDMNRYAQAEGGQKHAPISGVLIFERPAFPVDWLYARLFPHYSFERMEKLGMSIGEYDDFVRVLKQGANTVGSAVALQKVGIGQGVTPKAVRVEGVLKDSPAKDKMKAGDVIAAVNGQPIGSVTELSAVMRGVKPGEEVEVALLRSDERLTVRIVTMQNPDDPSRAAFGIQVADELSYDVPRHISFHDYLLHEGGPSHGAMLALTLIDQLTPGGVTNGNRIAGTGTIEPDGSVGLVGGVEQKAYTVKRSGADAFFVPAELEPAARLGAPEGLTIVPVKTLDDILTWLKDHPKLAAS